MVASLDDGQSALRPVGVVPTTRGYLARMYARRDFIVSAPVGQLRAQTQNTALGSLWHLLNPLLTAALFYLVFGVLFGGAGRVENYPAFLVVGIFTFLYTSRVATAAATSITGNWGLVTQINFPRLTLPLATSIAEALSHTVAIAALLLMLPLLGAPLRTSWLLVVPILALQVAFNVGVSFFIARFGFAIRDLENLLPHLLRFLLYTSGVFFSVDFVRDAVVGREWIVTLFEINPIYIFMSMMRDALIGRTDTNSLMVVASFAWSLAAVVGGFYYFKRAEVEYGRG